MRWIAWIGAAACAGVLGLAYAPADVRELGWLAPVGLWLGWAALRPRAAALCGWLAGFVFFMASLHWMLGMRQTQDAPLWMVLLSWGSLAGYCALWWLPAAVWTGWWFRRFGAGGKFLNLAWSLGAAAMWTGAEYLRGVAFSGFPWNALGVSQHGNLVVIQIADFGGVSVVSFVMAWFSAGVAAVVLRHWDDLRSRRAMRLDWHPELVLPLLAVGMSVAYGARAVRAQMAAAGEGSALKVACVQPNVAQYDKWDLERVAAIRRNLHRWSAVAGDEGPDLIVWPETALPMPWTMRQEAQLIRDVLWRSERPLLFGSIDYTDEEYERDEFRNQAVLVRTNGEVVVAEKQHLVAFGEYVPLKPVVDAVAGWFGKRATDLVPVPYECNPGLSNVVFELGEERRFCVLICFEDVLPYRARESVRAGGRLLVNLTNDGWFDPYAESEQHLAHGVFRSVEHRVPTVRCGNTGATCVIDTWGRVRELLPRLEAGVMTAELTVPPPDREPTVYTRVGDLFGQLCLVVGAGLLVWMPRARRVTRDRAG